MIFSKAIYKYTIWNHYKCSTLNNDQPWEISWEQVNFATIISIIINTNRTQKSSHIVCIICIVKHSNVQNLFSTILHCGILSPRECHFLYAFKYHTLLWLNAYFIAQRRKKNTKFFFLLLFTFFISQFKVNYVSRELYKFLLTKSCSSLEMFNVQSIYR